MIFGGYGKKAKVRGEVFYICTNCGEVNVFGLVETYGYGQLYGVRIAKVGTHRFMTCSMCQRGFELSKEQWQQARFIAARLASMRLLSDRQIGETVIEVARRLFPADLQQIEMVLSRELALAPASRLELNPASWVDDPIEAEAEEDPDDEPEEPSVEDLGFDPEPRRATLDALEKARQQQSAAWPWKAAETLASAVVAAWNDQDYAGLLALRDEARAMLEHVSEAHGTHKTLKATERDASTYAERTSAAGRRAFASERTEARRQERLARERIASEEAIAAQDTMNADEPDHAASSPPRSDPPPQPHDAAMLILRERLARGEISVEEYRDLRDALCEAG